MNCSRLSWPRSICLSWYSQLPVISGLVSVSTPRPLSSVIREDALAVGFSSRSSRSMYCSLMRPSMMDARVAGVPRPRSLIASRSSSSSTSLPAPSIAESKVASVYRGGGLVTLAFTSMPRVATRSPWSTGARFGVSSESASFP